MRDSPNSPDFIGEEGDFYEGHASAVSLPEEADILALHGSPLPVKITIGLLDQVVDDQVFHAQMKGVKIFEDPLGQPYPQGFGNGHDDKGGSFPVADEVKHLLGKLLPPFDDLEEGPFALLQTDGAGDFFERPVQVHVKPGRGFQVFEEELGQVEKLLAEQENIDQNSIPLEGWVGILIKPNNGTSVSLMGREMSIGDWKLAGPGRKERNVLTLPLRFEYLDGLPAAA